MDSGARCREGEDRVITSPDSLIKPLRVQLVTGKQWGAMELGPG
jgi:hypothetical protein